MPLQPLRTCLAAILALAMLGCSALPFPAPVSPPRPQDLLNLAGLQLLRMEQGHCSAVAISPTEALTARHCEVKPGDELVDLKNFSRLVQTVTPSTDRDMTRLTVDKPFMVWARLAPVATRQLGQPVLIGGYGCVPAPVPLPRAGVYAGKDIKPNESKYLGGPVCPGDSGGPIFDQQANLIGLVTRYSPGAPIFYGLDL